MGLPLFGSHIEFCDEENKKIVKTPSLWIPRLKLLEQVCSKLAKLKKRLETLVPGKSYENMHKHIRRDT